MEAQQVKIVVVNAYTGSERLQTLECDSLGEAIEVAYAVEATIGAHEYTELYAYMADIWVLIDRTLWDSWRASHAGEAPTVRIYTGADAFESTSY